MSDEYDLVQCSVSIAAAYGMHYDVIQYIPLPNTKKPPSETLGKQSARNEDMLPDRPAGNSY